MALQRGGGGVRCEWWTPAMWQAVIFEVLTCMHGERELVLLFFFAFQSSVLLFLL